MYKKALGLTFTTALLLVGCGTGFTPDTKAPQVTVTAPGAVVATPTLEVTGKITDDFRVASATYSLNGGAAQNITLGKDGTFKVTLNGLTERDHTLVITAKDNAGNSQSGTVNFKVQFADLTAPVIVLDAPVKDSTVTTVSTAIKGKVTDNRGVQSATISVNGGEAQTLTLGADGSFSFNQSGLDDGTYSVEIKAKDTSGNEKVLNSSFKVVLPDLFEPNNTFDKAMMLSYGTTTRKAIIDGSDFDVDWYKFEGKKDQTVTIEVLTQSAYPDSALDSVVELYPPILNSLTEAIASNDDADPTGTDMGSALTWTLTADSTYYVKVTSAKVKAGFKDDNAKNTYRVRLSVINPS